MARLPQPGSDEGTWGDVLNEFLAVSHTSTGTIKSGGVNATALQASGGTDGQVLTKDSAAAGGLSWTSATAPVTSVAGKTGAVSLVKADVGLGSVDNTSDASKPVSTPQQTALDGKLSWVEVVDANTARPAGASRVVWIGGTVQPVNMAAGDIWMQET